MNSRLLLIVVAVLLISASAQAFDVPTSRLQGADTFLSNDSRDDGNAVHGTRDGFEIRDYAGVRQRIGYLKFDITGVEPAPGYDMTNYLDNAVLYLQNSSKGKTMRSKWLGVFGLADNDTDDAWDEATTSYNNAPGMASAPEGYYAIDWKLYPRLGEIWVIEEGASGNLSDCYSSPTPVVQDGYAGSLDLSSLLYADTNGLVTLAVIFEFTDSKPDWWFSTKESVVADPSTKIAPTLILPNAVPEPATIVLLGIGGLSLLRIRKKS